MPDVFDVFDNLLATAVMAAGYAAGPTVVLWLGILLHELAHAVTACLVGARVQHGFVGSGRHVLPVRWFGARFELRLIPTHGAVWCHVPEVRFWRARMLGISLAGPLASTAVAAVFVWLWFSSPSTADAPLHSFHWIFAWQATLLTATPACVLAALVSWLPLQWSVAGTVVPSDVLFVRQLLRADGQQLEAMAREHAEGAAAMDAWNAFLDGKAKDALQQHRANDSSGSKRFEATWSEALYAWPVEGPDAALALLDRCGAEFAAWVHAQEQESNGADAVKALRRHVREFEKSLLVQRSFFGVVSGCADRLAEAAAATDEMLRRFPRDPMVQRTAGFVELHRGRIAEGMRQLRRAWLAAEPPWLRALTALYLAFGHSLRGRQGEAQIWLRRAKRLHPECILLPDYEARIRDAAAGASLAGGAAAR